MEGKLNMQFGEAKSHSRASVKVTYENSNDNPLFSDKSQHYIRD